ncbi:hypothetical protein [Streptomyces uncialis]|uniref:hypothetical protein n=1 Tax=Streptomyces uncialis TaxID=1048205 RepID=UPI002F943494|nr:hypothetical protein OG924_37030 [Streptomyces uncialis]
MTTFPAPGTLPDPSAEQLNPGQHDREQAAVLADARAAGIRAGRWLRSLAPADAHPVPGVTHPLLDLADAVEMTLDRLDPFDTAVRDPHTGTVIGGDGGVGPEVREQLWEGAVVLGDGLTPGQKTAVLAVAGAARLAADLHGYGDYTVDLPVLTAVIDHAVTAASG